VDRLRSCFASTWDLPGAPGVQGQYYFVPEGTEVFPSYLWSRHWRANSHEQQPTYGQQNTAPEYWTNGNAPPAGCVQPWVIACNGGRYPKRFQFDMGPIADAGCTGCAILGGLQTIEHVSGLCTWRGPTHLYCHNHPFGPFAYRYELVHNAVSGVSTLSLVKVGGFGPSILFRAARTLAWQPYSTLALITNLASGSSCAPWPAFVLVNPVP